MVSLVSMRKPGLRMPEIVWEKAYSLKPKSSRLLFFAQSADTERCSYGSGYHCLYSFLGQSATLQVCHTMFLSKVFAFLSPLM